jgi:four helix bundle protein
MAQRLADLRSWQLAREFKLEIYDLISRPPICLDQRLSDQLREAAASVPSNISEGFGRFDPGDFARFLKIARGSLLECKNHLIDAVDRGLVNAHDTARGMELLETTRKETGGLLDYLQSPEARRNAERIRQARFERRRQRKAQEHRTPNNKPRT